MEPGSDVERDKEAMFCPECGAEESGYFCRNCGTLLRGEDLVLCPRCHEVVPDAEYCNRCGQSLSSIALRLRQLAMAGDDFWVTSSDVSAETADTGTEPSLFDETPVTEKRRSLFDEDESLSLAEAELPDWLQELPVESAPAEVRERVYPALRPVQEGQASTTQGRFFLLFGLMGLLLLGLIVITIILLIQVA